MAIVFSTLIETNQSKYTNPVVGSWLQSELAHRLAVPSPTTDHDTCMKDRFPLFLKGP